MRNRLIVLAVTALLLTACGGKPPNASTVAGIDGQQRGATEINAQPRDRVRDGGDLRWPLDIIPDNFNINHVDGNLADTRDVMDALLPGAFKRKSDATVALDEDYFTSIELTSERPQVVTYTINPKATWSDGAPLVWTDLEAQWQALNGRTPAYRPADTTGYRDVASVERGVDDRHAVVTFAKPFAEWRSMFEFIYPAATNRDPKAFNTGWLTTIGATAGPFRPERIDTTAQTITLVRNEKWWGDRAKLDRIIYRVFERGALADALANNEIDWYQIGSDVNLFARAQGIPGAQIRQAVEPNYNHLTINGGKGRLLADPELRRALAQGIDRQAVARALIGQIAPTTKPLNNHLYLQGSVDYSDNAGPLAFDPAAANATLDRLGWVSPGQGQVRSRDGKPLKLRYVTTAGIPISDRITQLVTAQLAAIGIGVETVASPATDLFEQYVTPGDFDIVGFAYYATPFPISGTQAVYTSGSESNMGRVDSPEVDALYAKAGQELDDATRVKIGQQIDQKLWEAASVIPLYQSSGAYAVRSTLANIGAKGYADDTYTDIGFTG